MPGKKGWRAPLLERFMRFVDSTPTARGCLLWLGYKDQNGYGRFWHDGKNHNAHRVAAIIKYGEKVMAGKVARHTCDVRACVNGDHLLSGSQKDNHQDAVSRGRHAGQQHATHVRKLTDEQVLEIYKSEERNGILAKRFGVAPATICDVQAGRCFAWLTGANK